MAVIEMIMVLYAKEVVTPDRVMAAVQRFQHGPFPPVPQDCEEGLLLWISSACSSLKKRVEQEKLAGITNGGGEVPIYNLYYVCELFSNAVFLLRATKQTIFRR